jgi:hypothetical protein
MMVALEWSRNEAMARWQMKSMQEDLGGPGEKNKLLPIFIVFLLRFLNLGAS